MLASDIPGAGQGFFLSRPNLYLIQPLSLGADFLVHHLLSVPRARDVGDFAFRT